MAKMPRSHRWLTRGSLAAWGLAFGLSLTDADERLWLCSLVAAGVGSGVSLAVVMIGARIDAAYDAMLGRMLEAFVTRPPRAGPDDGHVAPVRHLRRP